MGGSKRENFSSSGPLLRSAALSDDRIWMQKHAKNSYIVCFKQSRYDSPCFYLLILTSNRDAKLCNSGKNLEKKLPSCRWLKLNEWSPSSPYIVRKQKLALWEGSSEWAWFGMGAHLGLGWHLTVCAFPWAKGIPASICFSLAPCVKYVALALASVLPNGIN